MIYFLPTDAPKIISFYSSECNNLGCVSLTCKAYGILPTMFNITFNGGKPEILPNGTKRINNLTKDTLGVYKCIAYNIIGNSSLGIELNPIPRHGKELTFNCI